MFIIGLLPYFTLLAIFFIKKCDSYRENYLYSCVVWGLMVAFTTMALSFFEKISAPTLTVAWIIFFICSVSLALWKPIMVPRLKLTWKIYLLMALATIPLAIGIIYPPNNWDSMTYHLPRVEHWLQNGTLSFYPTWIPRQNVMGQFAEICLVQLRALSGSDIFYNSLQWVAYISTLINISFIAKQLGASRQGQLLAAIISATVPMAILQASSTQNDLVISWWVTSLASLSLLWWERSTLLNGLMFGAALGLACMTKGTAYPLAASFVLFFSLHALSKIKKRLLTAICAGLIFFMLNLPLFIQNYTHYGSIWGGETTEQTLLQPSPKNFIANIICNIAINFEIPYFKQIHNSATIIIKHTIDALDIDKKTFYRWGEFKDRNYFSFHEDTAQAIVHMLLFLFCVPVFFFKRDINGKIYGVCVIAASMLFCCTVGWQPWITRFQQTLFFLVSPMVALVLNKKNMSKKICIAILIFYGITTNIYNASRPILKQNIVPEVSINLNREKNYFINYKKYYNDYMAAVNILKTHPNIGLVIGGDSWEYPLWVLLKKDGWKGRITHVKDVSDISKVDAIFMFGIEKILGFSNPKDLNPYVIELH